MSYQVLARKWRPRNFQQVVGQEHVLRALINALDNERLHHAYLFTGTRGVGKTTLGRILAKSLNCETGITSTPCGQCAACQEIDQGRFVDLLEVDAASRTKVDDTRDLLENVQYAPSRGRFKIYLIDEVHMLSDHSFNALLKTLEEPPPHVKFILATTDPQKIPITVLSRCLQFGLKNLLPDQINEYLQQVLTAESVPFEPEGVELISVAAEGSMRDSLSLLDQVIAFGGGQVQAAEVRDMLGSLRRDDVTPLLQALARSDARAVLNEVQQLASYGIDFTIVLDEIMALLHDLAVDQVLGAQGQGETSHPLAAEMSPADVQLYYQIALNGRADLSRVANPRNGFEMILLRMLAFKPAEFAARSATPSGSRSAATKPAAAAPASVQANRPTYGRDSAPTAQASSATEAPAPGRASAALAAATAGNSPAQPATTVSRQRTVTAAGQPVTRTAQPPQATPSDQMTESGNDWRGMVDNLTLSGMVRQLAVNCTLSAREGDTFVLTLARSHAQLASRNMVERLQSALRKQYGDNISIQVSVGEMSPAVETPAQQHAREHAERMQQATNDLHQNPSVQAMKETFGAQLDEQNIRLLDGQDQS